MKRNLLGVVLAGGKSVRMGENKAHVEARSGVSQLDYALSLLEPFCARLAVSVGDGSLALESAAEFEQIRDAEDVSGPMAGVLSALKAADGWPVLLIACDMPFLERQWVLQLLSRRDEGSMATCFVAEDGAPEPMCAIYEPACLQALQERADRGWLSLRRFLSESEVEAIALARSDFLASVNTPQELAEARARLRG